MFSEVPKPEENLFVVETKETEETDTEKNYGTDGRSMSLQSGLLVQFNDSVSSESRLSTLQFHPPKGNHHRKRGANYRERFPSGNHRRRSHRYDKRSKYDPRDSKLHGRIQVLEKRSQSPIRSYDDVKRNSRFQVFESDINEGNYNERVIKRSSSPEDGSKHKRFKNEKKIQIRHNRDRSRSPLSRLECHDGQETYYQERRSILPTQDFYFKEKYSENEHDSYYYHRTNFQGRDQKNLYRHTVYDHYNPV
jgi:hypothetical protein